MTDTTLPGVILKGVAASRPAANAVASGTIYSATDTGAITQSDGVSTWSAFATIPIAGGNPNFTTIELGHASDTTLSRVSAGVVAIEGTNIVKAGAATASGLTQATNKLLGRGTASTGAIEEITLGTNLSLSGTTINAAGGGAAAIATDTIWDAAGDMVIGTGADSAGRVAIGAASKVWQSDGSTAAWKYPPGYEMAYVEFTSVVTVTAGTVEATAVSVVSGGSVAFDGSTIVLIHFYAPNYQNPNTTDNLRFWLYDGSSSIGEIGRTTNPAAAAAAEGGPVVLERRMTPSNASHTYSIRASATNTASVSAGAGGASTYMPGFIRITKVSGGA